MVMMMRCQQNQMSIQEDRDLKVRHNVLVRQENEVPDSKERFLSNNSQQKSINFTFVDFLTRDGQVVHI